MVIAGVSVSHVLMLGVYGVWCATVHGQRTPVVSNPLGAVGEVRGSSQRGLLEISQASDTGGFKSSNVGLRANFFCVHVIIPRITPQLMLVDTLAGRC